MDLCPRPRRMRVATKKFRWCRDGTRKRWCCCRHPWEARQDRPWRRRASPRSGIGLDTKFPGLGRWQASPRRRRSAHLYEGVDRSPKSRPLHNADRRGPLGTLVSRSSGPGPQAAHAVMSHEIVRSWEEAGNRSSPADGVVGREVSAARARSRPAAEEEPSHSASAGARTRAEAWLHGQPQPSWRGLLKQHVRAQGVRSRTREPGCKQSKTKEATASSPRVGAGAERRATLLLHDHSHGHTRFRCAHVIVPQCPG